MGGCKCEQWAFGYVDADGKYKWHCRQCRTTQSGPEPTQDDVRESLADLARREAEFRAHTYLGEHAVRLADSLRRTADSVRAMLRERAA